MFGFLKDKLLLKRTSGKNQKKKENISLEDESLKTNEENTPKEIYAEDSFIKIPIVETAPRNNQQIARGVKDRLSSNLEYNVQKIRERIPSPNLIFEQVQLGVNYQKKVVISYLKNIANPDLVKQVKKRIHKVKSTAVLDSSFIERSIEDSSLSPFPQVEITDRPDTVESALLQGRIAIILEGSPDLLLVPTTFFDLMDVPEDAFRRWFFASSFFRVARFIMFLLALCLPGFYIALTSYNIEMIPTKFLTILLANRENAIFPIYFETFLMMGIVEAIRIMVLRMPTQLGATIALFGGITLVGAGLYANIICAPIVIIVTLTIISSYAIPNIDLRSSVRIIQFFTMILSTFLGLFGFAVAFFFICVHLVTLKSFGIPYLAPLAPIEASGWRHTILRGNTGQIPIDETYKPQNYTESKIKNQEGENKDRIDRLDPRVLGIILIVAIIEVDFATFPRHVVNIAGETAWLSMLIGAALVIITLVILIKLASLFPRDNFFTYCSKVWGKPIGTLINIGYLVFWFLFVSILLQDTANMNQGIFLPTTPSMIPLILILIAVIYLVAYGITNVIRLYQLLLPFIVLPLILVVVLMIRSIDLTNYLPFLSNGILPVFKGALVFLGAFQGLEIILFVAPFVTNINKAYLPAILSILFLMSLLLGIGSGSIGIMGVENIRETVLPSITMLSLIELPGFPVERFGLLLTLPVILGIFSSLAVYIYLISFALIDFFKIERRKTVISIVAVLSLIIIYFIPDLTWTMKLREILIHLTLLFILVIPLLTLISAKIRGQGELK